MVVQKGWKELKEGDIAEAGSAAAFETGDWRSMRPVHDAETCTNCLLCWINCPDTSVLVKDGKIEGFDMKHCKGCGICAEACPTKPKSIKMVVEED